MSILTAGEARRSSPTPPFRSDHAAAVNASAVRRSAAVPQPRRHVERPPLRLVEPARRPHRLRVGLVSTVCLVALFVGLFALAAMHSLVVQAQFALDRVDQEVSERRSQIEERRVDVAALESPEAVVAAAQEIGMVPGSPVVLLPDAAHLDPGTTEVEAAHPDQTPADEGNEVEQADGAPVSP